MNLIFKLVSDCDGDHSEYLSFSKKEKDLFPEWLHQYFIDWNIGPTQYCVLCFDDTKLIGLFKFNLSINKRWKTTKLKSRFTCVHPFYQNCNIGYYMWQRALLRFGVTSVVSYATSRGGLALLHKLRSNFAQIQFDINEDIDEQYQ